MNPVFRIVTDSAVPLWGLSSAERLRRQFFRLGVTQHEDGASGDELVLLLDARYLYDQRVLATLAKTPDVLLRASGDSTAPVVAAHVPPAQVSLALEVLRGERDPESVEGVRVERPDTLVPAFDDRLRRARTPTVLPVTETNRVTLENRLFADAYKGVTDLVTRFWWPRPARAAVRRCVQFGLSPNHVTVFGLFLVIVAFWCFLEGHFAWGLLAGWGMTFLDTVDGKLARVTVTSSRIGHWMDHGTDIIHPPLWYLAWGLGLASFHPLVPISLQTALVLLFAGYVLGRLAEGCFQLVIGMSGVFLWKRFDSYFRLITARRNPNMILLTASLVFGRPDLGLEAVVWWTVLTTLVLLLRLFMAIVEKARTGDARPWMLDVDPDTDRSLAVRWFAPHSVTSDVVVSPTERQASNEAGPRALIEPFVIGHGEAAGPRVGVVSNPRSRRNSRGGIRELSTVLGEHPAVLHREAETPEELTSVMEEFALRDVGLVALNGGDGTIDAGLDAIFGDGLFEELPLVAVLPGGRTNMTAGDVGVQAPTPQRALRRLLTWAGVPDPAALVDRQVLCLEGTDDGAAHFGLFFAAAGLHEATVRTWNFRAKSRIPGMTTGLGTAVSVGNEVVAQLLGRASVRPGAVRVRLDGEEVEETEFLALFVTTLERMALGLRPFWGRDAAPLRFTAISYEHRHLLRAAPALLRGKPNGYLRPEHGYASKNVHEVSLELAGDCTLDGEVVRPAPSTPLRLSAGPVVRFVRA